MVVSVVSDLHVVLFSFSINYERYTKHCNFSQLAQLNGKDFLKCHLVIKHSKNNH